MDLSPRFFCVGWRRRVVGQRGHVGGKDSGLVVVKKGDERQYEWSVNFFRLFCLFCQRLFYERSSHLLETGNIDYIMIMHAKFNHYNNFSILSTLNNIPKY